MVARRQIEFNNEKELRQFIFEAGNSTETFLVQDTSGNTSVRANSVLGMSYLWADTNGKNIYVVNSTHNGMFPSWLEKYQLIK